MGGALLPVHPGAVIGAGSRARAYPLLNLVWLAWMLAAPWYVNVANRPRVLLLTVSSVLVFMPLYLDAWFGDSRRITRNTGAIAVLGLAMVAVNTSWSYVIYAAALIPYCTRPKPALAWLALLMAAFCGVAMLMGFSLFMTVAAIAMCLIVASFSVLERIHHRHDAALRLSQDEVRRLATTAERERIGRDLHDLLGHTLSLIAVKSELARRLCAHDGDRAQREVEDIECIARDALAQVRRAVTGYRALGIVAELAAVRLLLESSGIALDYRGEAPPLSAAAESALALCLREAVTNVQRHARATRVVIVLSRDGPHATLTIHDDGHGGAIERGNGLRGIDERLRALGGGSTLQAVAGRGTRLALHLPLERDVDLASAA